MTTLSEAPSLRQRILGLLDDHLELAQLECRYESEAGRRRLIALAFVALCLVSAFVFMQIVLTRTLLHRGWSLSGACLALALFWSAAGLGIYLKAGRRDPRVPEAFEGTRQELRRSLQWMQKHIS
jgi:uncharacterized membrane protein YqjE